MRVREILNESLIAMEREIVSRMQQQGRMATGKTASSLTHTATDIEGTLSGSAAFVTLERGRGPGKVPSNFASIIREWIQAKGVSVSSNGKNEEQAIMSASYAIATHIKKNGTRLYRTGGYNDIYSTVIKKGTDDLFDKLTIDISSEIDKINEEFAK